MGPLISVHSPLSSVCLSFSPSVSLSGGSEKWECGDLCIGDGGRNRFCLMTGLVSLLTCRHLT